MSRKIDEQRGEGMGKIKIAKTLGIGVSTVQRVIGKQDVHGLNSTYSEVAVHSIAGVEI